MIRFEVRSLEVRETYYVHLLLVRISTYILVYTKTKRVHAKNAQRSHQMSKQEQDTRQIIENIERTRKNSLRTCNVLWGATQGLTKSQGTAREQNSNKGRKCARQKRAKIASDVKIAARYAKNNRKYRKNSKK